MVRKMTIVQLKMIRKSDGYIPHSLSKRQYNYNMIAELLNEHGISVEELSDFILLFFIHQINEGELDELVKLANLIKRTYNIKTEMVE